METNEVAPLPPTKRAAVSGRTTAETLRALATTRARRSQAWAEAIDGWKPGSVTDGVELGPGQIERLWSLAAAHGHAWGSWVPTGSFMTLGGLREFVCSDPDVDNASTVAGIMSPWVTTRGVGWHVTGTGRVRWAVWPDGSALLQVTRAPNAHAIDEGQVVAHDHSTDPWVVAQATVTPDGTVTREVGGVRATCRPDHEDVLDGLIRAVFESSKAVERGLVWRRVKAMEREAAGLSDAERAVLEEEAAALHRRELASEGRLTLAIVARL